jgi:hypothetical protein
VPRGYERLLAELAPQQSYEVAVTSVRTPDSEKKKRKKDTGHRLYQPSRAMAEAEELLMEITIKQAARSKCRYCKNKADKGLGWAGHRAIIICCDGCEKKARHQIEVKNKDEVSRVWDLVKERKRQGLE